jgi:hypothetical protein
MRKALSVFCVYACVIDLCFSGYDQSIQVEKQGSPARIFFFRDDVLQGKTSVETSTDSSNITNDLKGMRKVLFELFCLNTRVTDLCVSGYEQLIQVEKQGSPASIFFFRDDVSEGVISVEASTDVRGCAISDMDSPHKGWINSNGNLDRVFICNPVIYSCKQCTDVRMYYDISDVFGYPCSWLCVLLEAVVIVPG